MNGRMKKIMNMVLAFALIATATPVQSVNAAEEILIVDDQDIPVVLEEENPVSVEDDVTEAGTEIIAPEIEIIEDDYVVLENPEEISDEGSGDAGINYETETESEINAEETEQGTGTVSETEEELIFDVEEACDALELSADSGVEESNEDLSNIVYTIPEIEEFQDLWVGDEVYIGGRNGNNPSLEIILGESLITVEKRLSDPNNWKINCNQPGEAILLIGSENSEINPVEVKLSIKDRPREINISLSSKTMKLGAKFQSALYENLPLGTFLAGLYVNENEAEKFHIHGNRVAWGDGPYDKRELKTRTIFCKAAGDSNSCGGVDIVGRAIYPGTVNLMFYVNNEDFLNGKTPVKSISLNIEEPVIDQNIKETYTVGDQQKFSIRLDNTEYKDTKIDDLTEWGDNWIYYIPKLEIISGQECMELIGDQKITTLSLSQEVRFKKSGTVKLKISFVPSGTQADINNVYRPEKVITLQVKPEDVTAVFDSAGGSKVASQTVPSGSCIKAPGTPTRSGYKFLGWYQGSTKFDFSKPITGNITLTAKWEKQNVKITSVKLNKASLRLKIGQTYKLEATVKPSDATNKTITWSTSNKEVATVSGGKITAKGAGTATITAKAADGSGKAASCKVTVGYTIKYQLKGGKNNSKNPAVYYKENITLKNPTRDGYLFKGWYTDKNYKKEITKITTKDKKNLALYAKWEKVSVGKTAISTLKNASGKKISLKYKAISKAAGYEILYSTDAKFKKNCTSVTTKKKTLTIKGLTKKKTYYVKVRAYRTDSAGKKVYGKYSTVKKVKISR